jgi:hypothetical protein
MSARCTRIQVNPIQRYVIRLQKLLSDELANAALGREPSEWIRTVSSSLVLHA